MASELQNQLSSLHRCCFCFDGGLTNVRDLCKIWSLFFVCLFAPIKVEMEKYNRQTKIYGWTHTHTFATAQRQSQKRKQQPARPQILPASQTRHHTCSLAFQGFPFTHISYPPTHRLCFRHSPVLFFFFYFYFVFDSILMQRPGRICGSQSVGHPHGAAYPHERYETECPVPGAAPPAAAA
jgi:hypothetical protein